MTDASRPIDPEHLLEEASWVRRLAGGLLADPTRADDASQQALVTALEHRAEPPRHLRAWLAGVLRNTVRREQRGATRRRRREERAARDEALPSAAELAARADLHRRVVSAVLELPEPYRTTVLERFFMDRTPEQIAERSGEPGATVRSRLRRALQKLRVALDESVGDRETWTAALLPLALLAKPGGWVAAGAGASASAASGAGASSGAGAGVLGGGGAGAGAVTGTSAGIATATATGKLGGVLTMAMQAKTMGVAAALLLAGAVWWLTTGDEGAPVSGEEPVAAVPTGTTPREPSAPRVEEAVEPLRLAVDPAPAAPADAATAPAPVAELTGRVVDPEGRPLAGAEVRFAWHTGLDLALAGLAWPADLDTPTAPTEGVRSDEDGRFRFVVEDLAGTREDSRERTYLAILHDAHAALLYRNEPLTAGPRDLGEIVLAPGSRVRGRVVDGRGRPVPGVKVQTAVVTPDDPAQMSGGVRVQPHVQRQRFGEAFSRFPRAFTDADGRFDVGGYAAGEVTLRVSRPGLRDVALRGLRVTPPVALDVGDVLVDEGASIRGTVRDGQGEPLAGALVFAHTPEDEGDHAHRLATSGRAGARRAGLTVTEGEVQELGHGLVAERVGLFRATTTTDEDGRFALGGLVARTFAVHATAEGFAWTHVEQVGVDGPALELTVERPGTLLVDLSDGREGTPLEGATIRAARPEAYEDLPHRWNAYRVVEVTGEGVPGRYRVEGVGREGVELDVRATGYRHEHATGPGVAAGELAQLSLTLDPGLAVAGRVVDQAGAPVQEAVVQIAARRGPAVGTSTLGTRTGPDGRFAFDMLTEGTWGLWVYADGYLGQAQATLELPAAGDEELLIMILRAAVVEGTVRATDGSPVPLAGVVAVPLARPDFGAALEPGEALGSVTTTDMDPVRFEADEDGRFHASDLAPGEYALLATHRPEHAGTQLRRAGTREERLALLPEQAARLTLVGGDRHEVELTMTRPATLSGRVTSHEGTGSRGIAGAEIVVWPVPVEDERWRAAGTAISAGDGSWAFDALEPGAYGLALRPGPGAQVRLRRVELVEGGSARVDLLAEGSTISGRVVAAGTGAPLPGAAIEAVRRTEAGPVPGFDAERSRAFRSAVESDWIDATSDADGSFTLRHLDPVGWSVNATLTGHLRSDTVHVTLDPEDRGPTADPPEPIELELELEPAGFVEVDVTYAASFEPQPTHVEIRHPLSHERWRAHGGWDAVRRFDPVPAGRWEVRLLTQGDDPRELASERIEVEVGETTRVALTARGP